MAVSVYEYGKGEVGNVRRRTVSIPRLQNFAAIFFGVGAKIIFFGQKIPYVAIFYCLGWLVVIWYYF